MLGSVLWVSAWAEEETGRQRPALSGTFGEGVTLTVPDDSLSLNLAARVQVRSTLLFPSADAEGEQPLSELAIRRARVTLEGHALTRDLTYYVQLSFSNQDNEPDLRLPLRDAYLTWAGLRDLQIRVGQGKVPFGRQRIISSGSLQLVDRSIVISELNLDRDVGVTLLSDDLGGADGRFGYAVGLFGGDGRNRLSENLGYLGAARLWVRPLGEFDDEVEADFERSPKLRLAVGASVAYNQATFRPGSTTEKPYRFATFDYRHAGLDAMLKWRGATVQGEWMMRRANRDAVTTRGFTEHSRSAWGWHLQIGQLLTEQLELAARHAALVPFSGTDPALERARELGGGASWYFHEHALKLQADYFYLPTGRTLQGGAHQVRTQLQLAL